MTPEEMASGAMTALAAGMHMTLIHGRTKPMPPKFPRGELLCENFEGTRTYSYDPAKVLAWLHVNGLVKVVTKLTGEIK